MAAETVALRVKPILDLLDGAGNVAQRREMRRSL
jgi:hypothetical protein